ncbi:unnamed protein product [Discosporangium mesarthrocarpum]
MRLSHFMAIPTTAHFPAAKRLCSWSNHYSTRKGRLELREFADANYACDPESGRSISGYIFTLVGTAISWPSKLQPVGAQSTTEAEYIALGDTAKEAVYLDSFITELGPFKMEIITIHEDMGALHLASSNILSAKTKHILVRYHFLKQLVQEEKIHIKHVASSEQLADILTKPLPRPLYHPS